jgi:hypothetical protein
MVIFYNGKKSLEEKQEYYYNEKKLIKIYKKK